MGGLELALESLSLLLTLVIIMAVVGSGTLMPRQRVAIVILDFVLSLGLVAGIAGTLQAWPT